jgi:hypothetical protein
MAFDITRQGRRLQSQLTCSEMHGVRQRRAQECRWIRMYDFFQFIAGCADVSSHSHISFNMLSPTLDNAAEDRGDDLSLVFSSIQPFNHNSHPHPPCELQHDPGPLPVKEMEQAASLARLERSSAQRRRRLRSSLLRQPRRSGRRKWKSAHSWTQSLPRRNIL